MNEETPVVSTEGAPAPVENAAPTPADEGKALNPGTTDTPADAAESSTPETEEKKRNRVPASKRISELTGKIYQLKDENTELKKRLEEVDRRNPPQEPVKPKLADFGSDAEYETAMDQFYQSKASYDSTQARQQQTKEQIELRKQQEISQSTQKFVQDLQRDKSNYEGIETVMADPAFALVVKHMSSDLINLIQTSDKNVALAYHLGTHLDEAEEIASLPIAQAARKLAHLESRLELPKPKTVSNAPDPIKPVQAKSTKEIDISDPNISDKEFNEKRRKQIAAKRGRG